MSKSSRRKLNFVIILLCVCLLGCTPSEITQVARIAASRNIETAARQAAVSRALSYTYNPEALARDIRRWQALFQGLRKKAGKEWGPKETKEPQPKEYVKYTNNYLSRASVDFDTGLIAVETLDQNDPL
ncbi:MAG: murein transglycosylase domain-containing protein, partial [Pseudomonadota bacterium]